MEGRREEGKDGWRVKAEGWAQTLLLGLRSEAPLRCCVQRWDLSRASWEGLGAALCSRATTRCSGSCGVLVMGNLAPLPSPHLFLHPQGVDFNSGGKGGYKSWLRRLLSLLLPFLPS